MIGKRLIPTLLLDRKGRLVKTVKFRSRTYVGDPLNMISIFNDFEVDEVCILDIDATPDRREPNFTLIEQIASQCFMPLAYGGGIARVEHARRLINMGVEKLVIRSLSSEMLMNQIQYEFGSQALIACIDYVNSNDLRLEYSTRRPIMQEVERVCSAGAGEIILQSIGLDGTRSGMDIDALKIIAASAPVPVIALGGAGDLHHIREALRAGASAVASGSAFTFVGPLRAVLPNYPTIMEREALA